MNRFLAVGLLIVAGFVASSTSALAANTKSCVISSNTSGRVAYSSKTTCHEARKVTLNVLGRVGGESGDKTLYVGRWTCRFRNYSGYGTVNCTLKTATRRATLHARVVGN